MLAKKQLDCCYKIMFISDFGVGGDMITRVARAFNLEATSNHPTITYREVGHHSFWQFHQKPPSTRYTYRSSESVARGVPFSTRIIYRSTVIDETGGVNVPASYSPDQ
jgi:hypothetical protein